MCDDTYHWEILVDMGLEPYPAPTMDGPGYDAQEFLEGLFEDQDETHDRHW